MTVSMPVLVLAVAVIASGQVTTTTVTGPIVTPTPDGSMSLAWVPEEADQSLVPVLPDFYANMDILISIALAWVRDTWLDGQVLDYWMLYQVAVGLFGRFIGSILGRGGFSIRDRVEINRPEPQQRTEER